MSLLTKTDLEIRPLASALGAEIFGVDLAEALEDATLQALRAALLEHVVIFFRDQELAPQQLLALAERFGEVGDYPFIKGLPECPLVLPVIKEPHERSNFGVAFLAKLHTRNRVGNLWSCVLREPNCK